MFLVTQIYIRYVVIYIVLINVMLAIELFYLTQLGSFIECFFEYLPLFITNVGMKRLTNKWHILKYDWSVRPIIRNEFLCRNVLRHFCQLRRTLNVYTIRYDWLIDLYLFIPLVCKTIFLIKKNSCIRDYVSSTQAFPFMPSTPRHRGQQRNCSHFLPLN